MHPACGSTHEEGAMPESRERRDFPAQPDQAEPMRLPRSDNDPPDSETVARRAYQRYEERGYEHGRDQEDWFEAERELREQRESRNQG